MNCHRSPPPSLFFFFFLKHEQTNKQAQRLLAKESHRMQKKKKCAHNTRSLDEGRHVWPPSIRNLLHKPHPLSSFSSLSAIGASSTNTHRSHGIHVGRGKVRAKEEGLGCDRHWGAMPPQPTARQAKPQSIRTRRWTDGTKLPGAENDVDVGKAGCLMPVPGLLAGCLSSLLSSGEGSTKVPSHVVLRQGES